MNFTVKPILAGEFGPVRDDIKYWNGNPGNQDMVPSYIFHLKTDTSSVIVDMSFSSPEKCIALTGLKCERKKSLECILQDNGINRLKVDMVICTHLHWDHAGNGSLFPNARIICQSDELKWAVDPPQWEPGYGNGFSEEIVEVLDRIRPIDGNAVLDNGLELVKLGGHTRGSQAVVVNTASGKVIIAGDVIMTYKNIEKSIPVGLFTDLNECIQGVNWVKSWKAAVLPSHDWKTLEYRQP